MQSLVRADEHRYGGPADHHRIGFSNENPCSVGQADACSFGNHICRGLMGPLFKSGFSYIDATAFAQAFAQFLLAVQALEMVRHRSAMDINYLPGLGAITFALLLLSSEEMLGYRTTLQMTISFLVALVWVLRPELPVLFFGDSLMRHKGNTLLMLLSGVWLVGSIADQQLATQLPALQQQVQAWRGIEIDMVSSQQVRGTTPLVDRVGLSSQVDDRLDGPETVLFEVAGSQPPGYMRTVSFTLFDGDRWRNRWEGHGRQGTDLQVVQVAKGTPTAEASPLESQSSHPWFALLKSRTAKDQTDHQESDKPLRDFEVTIPYGRGKLVPVPIGCEWIQCGLDPRTSVLLLDVHGNVWPGSISNQRYRVLTSKTNDSSEPFEPKISDAYMASLLAVPPGEQRWIEQVKPRVFRSGNRFDQRCRDVEQFFLDEFAYATENDIDQVRGRRTKLQTFIEDRKAAHCEYFAAASVLLLRSQAIPARLSTGYLVYELDNDEEDFAARKRNAHAWAEAYDATANRWRVVESTPGTSEYIERNAVPDSQRAKDARLADGDAQQTFYALMGTIWNWTQLQLWRFFSWQHSWVLLTFVVLALLTYRTYQHSHRFDGRCYSKEARRADRLAKRLGYERGIEETCVRFAYRLASDERPQAKQLATWYIDYGHSRYHI